MPAWDIEVVAAGSGKAPDIKANAKTADEAEAQTQFASVVDPINQFAHSQKLVPCIAAVPSSWRAGAVEVRDER